MYKFLETDSLPKLSPKETVSLNRLITRSKIDSVIKKQKQKTPCKQKFRIRWLQQGILPNIQRTHTYHSQAIPKIEEVGKFPKSFYEATIAWYQRHYKKIQTNVFDDYRLKILNKISANWIQQYVKRVMHYYQVGFNPKL